MARVAPDLRPRGAVELYDAALHLCMHGETALPGLALLGAVLPATSGLWVAWRALHNREVLVSSAVFTLCLMLRFVFLGAAALAGGAALEGEDARASKALRTAFSRTPSLLGAGGTTLLFNWLLLPMTMWIAAPFTSQLYAAPALVARGEAGPFSVGGAARRRLSGGTAAAVRALHGLALLLLLGNLHAGLAFALYLGRSLFALDVTFLSEFASLKNAFYLFTQLALAMVLLEPVKAALGLLLLVDARVRSEGLDLKAAVERLSSRGRGGHALALVIAASLSLSGSARADSDSVARLAALAERAGISKEPSVRQAIGAAEGLGGEGEAALRHLVDHLEGADLPPQQLAAQLREGLVELSASAVAAPPFDARAAARQILSAPEFERDGDRAIGPDEDRANAEEGWLSRFLRWLDKKTCSERPRDRASTGPSVPFAVSGGLGEFLTYALVGIAALLLLVVLARSFGREPASPEPATASAVGAATPLVDELSALAKVPEGWWSDADRFAAAGDFRQAVRALYLAVLSSLHRRGAIDYDPARSNWDYVRTFQGGLDEKPRFRELTLRFDFAWYGRFTVDRDGYGAFRALSQGIFERTGAPDA